MTATNLLQKNQELLITTDPGMKSWNVSNRITNEIKVDKTVVLVHLKKSTERTFWVQSFQIVQDNIITEQMMILKLIGI